MDVQLHCQEVNTNGELAPNPSIERTPKSQLRCLLVTAHVER
jgi:hypothetical protein